MEFLLNSVSGLLENLAAGVAPACMLLFFEPEVPESLREE